MAELKPCPFCGKTPSFGKVRFGMEQDYRYTLHCDECCYNIGWLVSEDEAAAKWNRRAEDQDMVKVVRCKDCKHYDQEGICSIVGGVWDEYEFCSEGERQSGGQEDEN